jgi:hypothetical protein
MHKHPQFNVLLEKSPHRALEEVVVVEEVVVEETVAEEVVEEEIPSTSRRTRRRGRRELTLQTTPRHVHRRSLQDKRVPHAMGALL